MKILAVDDDPDLLPLIRFALVQAGFTVTTASDGLEALLAWERESPDLIVLDINLPQLNGFQVCRRIRERASTPIIMLTARGEEEDVVRALDLGADDYLTKPFSPRTLIARARAVLRRAGGEPAVPVQSGGIVLDPEQHMVRIEGGPAIELTRLEVRLLQALLAGGGRTVTADRLLAQVWGHRGQGDRQLLKQLVHRLRQKIEPDPSKPRLLHTGPGPGYRLELLQAGDDTG
jgi:DNA-binding response OmpR family regulator